jgi:hypothetical protein
MHALWAGAPPGAARWGSCQGPQVGGSWRQEDVDGNSVGLSGSLPSLSRLLKRWAPGSGPLGCLVWSLGAPWASGARGSRAGDPWAAAVFPLLTPALEFAVLGADYGADADGTYMD